MTAVAVVSLAVAAQAAHDSARAETAALADGSASAAGPAAPAAATDPSGEPRLQEVIVTAQKRSENLQNVPIAVSTLDAAQLTQANITNFTDLGTAVPGLNVINANGILNVSLRGIGSNAVAPGFENPVALYVDGVYYASAVANYLDLANISQVAVLKGPQGTLFGRNATGGLVQVTTRDPTQETTLQGNVSYGNFQTSTATLYASSGFGSNLAGDVSVYAEHQGGNWGTNVSTGGDVYVLKHDLTVRSKWIFSPSDDTKFTLIGDYSDINSNLNVPTVVPGTISGFTPELGVTPGTGYDVADDAPNYKKGHATGGSLKWDQNLGAVALSSLTAYRTSTYTTAFELDGGPEPLANAVYTWPDNEFTEELQIQSKVSSPFTWQAGVYFFDGRASYEPISLYANYLGANISINNKQSTQSIAGYAQGSYQFTDQTTLTLGGRYTSETRKAYLGSTSVYVIPLQLQLPPEVAPDEKVTFDKFNYRVALDHRFSEELMAYVSTSTGFKSGGFNTGSPGTPAYQPETVTAYEIGTKSDLMSHRVRWNNAAYYYDYKDLQTQVLVTSGVISITNAASAHIYGLDSDLQVQATDALRWNAAVSFNHATYSSYPDALLSSPIGGVPSTVGSAAGNSLPYAPKWTGNIGGDYSWTLPVGTVKFATNLYYNNGYSFEADNVIRQQAYFDLASDLRWTSQSGRWWVGAFGKNLLDKQTIGYATTQSNGTHLLEWAAPRTYGIQVGANYP